MDLHIAASQEANTAAVVDALVELAGTRDPVHVGLTGGSMGVAVAAEIGRRWGAGEADFSGVHWWFSDERHLPAGDAGRALSPRRAARLQAAESRRLANRSPVVSSAAAQRLDALLAAESSPRGRGSPRGR